MLTTADAPAHDEERERDRLSLQNHVISFSNETLDEVKETILETPKWKFQRGDDAGGMQPLCNTVHFSLSPLIHAQKKKPRPFSLYNVFFPSSHLFFLFSYLLFFFLSLLLRG